MGDAREHDPLQDPAQGTPSEQTVQQDFTVPADADLRPADDDTETS